MADDKRRGHAPLIEELTSGEEEKGEWNDGVRWPKHGGAMGGESPRGTLRVWSRCTGGRLNRRAAYQGAERRQTLRAARPDHAKRCWLPLRYVAVQ